MVINAKSLSQSGGYGAEYFVVHEGDVDVFVLDEAGKLSLRILWLSMAKVT